MESIIASSSAKDSGIVVLDLTTLTNEFSLFKGSISETGSLCTIGGSSSSNGIGGSPEYIITSQTNKPTINVYNFSKSSPLYQCHTQEIVTSICCDNEGVYIFGGTKQGQIFCWELKTGKLLTRFDGHFKKINKMKTTCCGRFLISASDDGICKVWDIIGFTDINNDNNDDNKIKKIKVSPFRTWNPHSLSVRDIHIIGSISNLRVLSSSLDKTIVIYDVYSSKQCFSYTFPYSIEAVTANSNMDFIFGGSSNGVIYRLNFSTFSHSYNQQAKLGLMLDNNKNSDNHNIKSMIGHTSNITCLQCSIENNLVSSSNDGSIRIWNIISGQCLNEVKPFQKKAITDFTIIMKSDQLDDYKNVIIPFEPLKKYDTTGGNNNNEIPKLGIRLIGSNCEILESKKRKRDNNNNKIEW